jgi:hypothetical protein
MDCRNIALQVYELAASEDPLAPLVKEALDVIDEGLDTHGYFIIHKSLLALTSFLFLGRRTFPLASTEAKTVSSPLIDLYDPHGMKPTP